ncbi:unnamed protein product [Rhizophagus irregularis]|nr:unnamed protein product [Rhizophagus irregularis]
MVSAPVIPDIDVIDIDTKIDMEISPVLEDSVVGPSNVKLHDNGLSWHASLGMLIPDELFPYVNDPVYISKTQERKKGRMHEPGSEAWFIAVKLRKENAEAIERRKQLFADRDLKAKLWGTSSNRIENREQAVDELTDFQNYYYENTT